MPSVQRAPRQPKYCLHRPSGQAVVTLVDPDTRRRRDVYLGKHGTQASRQRYDQVIAEFLLGGRRVDGGEPLLVTQLICMFLRHAKKYYRRADGSLTSEFTTLGSAFRQLKAIYGTTPAADFDSLKLKVVRQQMIADKWERGSINKQVQRIRRLFNWGVGEKLVPGAVLAELSAKVVPGLKAGRSEAKESKPVQPVPMAHVEAVLAHVSPQVAAMIRVQLLSGRRPGEVVQMRPSDIETDGALWVYRPPQHKTLHHGHAREIYLDSQAQEVLKPFLRCEIGIPLFCEPIFKPAEAARRKERRSPLWPSHVERYEREKAARARESKRRKRNPRRPGGQYTVASYRIAIARACVLAGVSHWHPHQLRHTAGTEFRKRFGLEAASVLLGHRNVKVTELYAKKNVEAAKRLLAG